MKVFPTIHCQEMKEDTYYNSQVYENERPEQNRRRVRNACKILQTTPTYVLPHPLNIEIYGLKFDSII